MAEAALDSLQLTRKDFVSDQEVRWCPGCGDYAILAQMQRVLPELGIPREQIVFISGIGCSSRFPYYMNTYGVHSIHGRAPTLASGLKVANPDLHVWVITGDGDGLSIGGNHLLHILRRNVDVNIILFNNRIYGLTKGQYSPTSLPGHKTYSSPMGSIEQSFNPISVAIGAEATFVARSVDRNTKHLAEMLRRAAAHKGTSFVEVYQNCNIYNDGAWFHITEADVKDDNTLILENGQPMIFGKERDKGVRMNDLRPEVVSLGNGASADDLLVHDESADPPALAYMLSRMEYPDFPVPLGVLRCVDRPVYEEEILAQGRAAVSQQGEADLSALYHAADTWVVSEEDSIPTERDVVEEEIETDIPDIIPGIGGEDPIDPKGEFERLVIDPISTVALHLPEFIAPGASMLEAMALMEEKDAGCLLVSEDGVTLQGILAEGDFFVKVVGNDMDLATTPVEDVMTPNPTTMRLSDPIGYALHLMDLHGYRHIPVVDHSGRVVKVISFRAALEFFAQLYDNGANGS